ncbi:hypothetical protein CAPTEDRAFT_211404 [Capitella teleta]|uniref:Uncharacterized protein n=1 Tax=Capitella teleta TaxID=283909 RepID=R7TCB1_CAPTE|nr:hypothetical protein CAPTEDRAFT_211404 [Capitella teleta]|eukprot:ELT91329.1 hypothetical protein CAPTEDRAFT_211404 [Capitella teleta]
MAEDSNKTELWACAYVIVCSGEQNEDTLQQVGMLGMSTTEEQRLHQCKKQSISGMASPAELLNQRRLQTVLPVKAKDSSDRGSQHRERMAAERDKRRHRFNQRARKFRELQLNENVYVQIDPEKSKWQRGNIVGTPTTAQPRSYRVQLPSGQRFQRNRRRIRSDRCTEGGNEDIEDPRRTLPRRSGRDLHFPSRLHYDRLGEPAVIQ